MSEQPVFEKEWKIVSLEKESHFVPNGIVSRTLFQSPFARQILFGFAEGQELTEHISPHHALVHILSGGCVFTLDGESHPLHAGDLLYMPPGLPHGVRATEKFSMLLTLASTKEAATTTPVKIQN